MLTVPAGLLCFLKQALFFADKHENICNVLCCCTNQLYKDSQRLVGTRMSWLPGTGTRRSLAFFLEIVCRNVFCWLCERASLGRAESASCSEANVRGRGCSVLARCIRWSSHRGALLCRPVANCLVNDADTVALQRRLYLTRIVPFIAIVEAFPRSARLPRRMGERLWPERSLSLRAELRQSCQVGQPSNLGAFLLNAAVSLAVAVEASPLAASPRFGTTALSNCGVSPADNCGY